jgi:predicted RNA-binding protein with PUA-like domain
MPKTAETRRHWLVKTEPDCFSWDDLWASPGRTTHWDGVRNYQARNMLRDEMKRGDRVLFYHSSCEPPCVVGVAEVVREGYPDFTAFDPAHEHFDPKSKEDAPTWSMVDLKAVRKFARPVTLAALRATAGLGKMTLLQKGSRLSVMPVQPEEFAIVEALGASE